MTKDELDRIKGFFLDHQTACDGSKVPIDSSRIAFIKNGLALIAAIESAWEERDKWKEQSFRPLGDNHHNAAICPHCSPNGKTLESENAALQQRIGELQAYKKTSQEEIQRDRNELAVTRNKIVDGDVSFDDIDATLRPRIAGLRTNRGKRMPDRSDWRKPRTAVSSHRRAFAGDNSRGGERAAAGRQH